MLVKCKSCGKKIERDIAYKIVIKGKNNYYCSQNEFESAEKEKKARLEVLELARMILDDTLNTLLPKELKQIAENHSYYKILQYLNNDLNIRNIISRKSFSNEYAKIKYFSAIVRNNIGNFYVEKESDNKKIEVEYVQVKHKPKKRKKSLNEYIDEYVGSE